MILSTVLVYGVSIVSMWAARKDSDEEKKDEEVFEEELDGVGIGTAGVDLEVLDVADEDALAVLSDLETPAEEGDSKSEGENGD